MTDPLHELGGVLRDAEREDADLALLLERRTEIPALAKRARQARQRQRAGLLALLALTLVSTAWFASRAPHVSSSEEIAAPRTPAPDPAPAPSVRGIERVFPEEASWPNLSTLLDPARPLRVDAAPRTMLAWELHPEDDLEVTAPPDVFYTKRDARVFLGASAPGTYALAGRHRRRTFQERDGAYALVEGPWRDVTILVHVTPDAAPRNVIPRTERTTAIGNDVRLSLKEPYEVVAVTPKEIDISWDESTARLRPKKTGRHEALVLSPEPKHIIVHVPPRNP